MACPAAACGSGFCTDGPLALRQAAVKDIQVVLKEPTALLSWLRSEDIAKDLSCRRDGEAVRGGPALRPVCASHAQSCHRIALPNIHPGRDSRAFQAQRFHRP